MNGRKTPRALVVSCAALLALTACADDPERPPTSPTRQGVAATPGTPPATASADAATPTPTSSPSVTSAAALTVPKITGLRLSEGESHLRALGFLSINVVDASGAGRLILEKENWVILRQNPPAGAAAESGVPVTLSVGKPTDAQPTIKATKGTVPDVRCHDLQAAQDALRTAGFYLLLPKDGLGQGRFPLVDRNWIVVGQSVAPGSSPSASTTIELTVIKYGEPTGNSGCAS